jgi:hypothetical protein
VAIDPAGDQGHIADPQGAHLLLGQRGLQHDLATRPLEPRLICHRRHWRRRFTVQPRRDRSGRPVQHHAKSPEGPAVVRDRHEETRREAVLNADLAPDERGASTEAHRTDPKVVHLAHDRRFEFRQSRVGIHVIEGPEQLFLRVHIARRPITADADTNRARCTALALRIPHGVQDALAHASQRPVSAAEVG